MHKTGLTDQALQTAVSEMRRGLVDADLGAGVLKKRIAIKGQGKSGGVRTFIATNKDDYWIFVFGFAKAARANITDAELKALQNLADNYLRLPSSQLRKAAEDNALLEVDHDP
jgi:hypothetical protein